MWVKHERRIKEKENVLKEKNKTKKKFKLLLYWPRTFVGLKKKSNANTQT